MLDSVFSVRQAKAARGLLARTAAGLGTLALLFGCSSLNSPDRESRVWLRGTGFVLDVGDTATVGFVMRHGDDLFESPSSRYPLPSGTAAWRSSNEAVAIIDAKGIVTAVAPGSTVLTVSLAGLTDTATVNVLAGPASVRFAQVVTGTGHSCGLSATGRGYCWGSLSHGQTGVPLRRYTRALSPQSVLSSQTFTQLVAGGFDTCGLASDGRAFCWGDNLSGQLGSEGGGTHVPTAVETNLRFSRIAIGSDRGCGVTLQRTVFCWGRGQSGTAFTIPTGFQELSVGLDHVCATDTQGRAYCWGANTHGQLGAGDALSRTAPTPVSGTHTFVAISAGGLVSCGIVSTGAALRWGDGTFGKLGTGDDAARGVPTPVQTNLRFRTISVGTQHTCAIAEDSSIWCWGTNLNGRLGFPPERSDPTAADLIYRTPQRVTGLSDARSISASTGAHTCALTLQNQAFCWGFNISGELGYGKHDFFPGTQLEMRFTPTSVRSTLTGLN